MAKMKKLPDAEFDIMKVIWANTPPITANMIMKQHGNKAGWKVQTAISLLLRLVERGFLHTEKIGKERTYFPLVDKDAYLKFETGNFMKQFHDNSFLNFVTTMYADKALTDEDIGELLEWIQIRRS
ncbi:MAG: BlaI/MecI/CopY family transcriptional regulator [Oscillospiraceae bacterium]|nr:BlaI/MecI/CopY family transcriptional regulator [Oscillospiraceae bacterium]